MTTFMRLLEASVDDKAAALREAIASIRGRGEQAVGLIFERDPEGFAEVPGSPFAYWASDSVRAAFRLHPHFGRAYVAIRGAYTTDDFKYYRLVWEVPDGKRAHVRQDTLSGRPYVALAKGGAFSAFYADVHLMVRWHDDGAEPKVFLSMYRERKGWGTDWSACLNGYGHYFRPGLTWPRRTTSGLGLRILPAGCIFADKGPAAFVEGDNSRDLLALCSIMNSAGFRYLVGVQLAAADAAARSYEVGVIQQTPVPRIDKDSADTLSSLARRTWSLRRTLDTTNETSHAFVLPPGLNETVTRLDRAAIERELAAIQREIDDRAFELYGIGPEDRAAIEALSKGTSPGVVTATEGSDDDSDDDASEEDESPVSASADTLLSWLVGVAFGRFDKRLATGERAIPPEPEPFDPLPSRSPGMWPEDEPRAVPPPDILVDDPGHERDLVAHVTQASAGTGFDVPHDVRPWLARELFPLHIKMYSKSRRKAPIYWQLATPSASYSVWLYIHAFTRDTFYKVQNEYVAPKVAHEERKLEALRQELGENPRAAERKALAAQESFVEELRAFLDEVKRVAPLWNPDLDDGVIINFAPLWRLVPHHKPWQKELVATWDALCAGKYDWAHLAMHLWPERVVPKCATDRSLAIAHGLEDVFWLEDANGKWKPRVEPLRPVDELVRERTSPAVKAALQSLLDAPVAPARKASTRKKRAR